MEKDKTPKKECKKKLPYIDKMIETSIVVYMAWGFIGGCLSVAVEPFVQKVLKCCIRS